MQKNIIVEFTGISGSGKSIICSEIKKILDQEKFSVYVANSRWTQTFRSIPDIRLLIKIIGWVFKTGQKSMPIFGKSVYCWYKSQITIKRLRKRPGIFLIEEGYIHKFRQIRRGSRHELSIHDVYDPGFYEPDMVVIVNANSDAIIKRRMIRDGVNLEAAEVEKIVKQMINTINDCEALRLRRTGFSTIVIDNDMEADIRIEAAFIAQRIQTEFLKSAPSR